jgi:hypothetical protein
MKHQDYLFPDHMTYFVIDAMVREVKYFDVADVNLEPGVQPQEKGQEAFATLFYINYGNRSN